MPTRLRAERWKREELGLIDNAYEVLSFPSFYFMALTLARSDKQALWMRGRRGFKSRLSAKTWAMIANVGVKLTE